jgi:hypothetical protein
MNWRKPWSINKIMKNAHFGSEGRIY